jgi:hypothetical protein
MSREAARREVRRAVEASGETIAAFAARAKVDTGTLGDFLNGGRWPHTPTRRKIETALGWPAGRISDLADGPTTTTPAHSSDVLAAIEDDPALLPEAKAHLINQYELLLRIQAAASPALLEEQEARRQQAKVEAEGRAILEDVSKGRVAPRRGKDKG